MLNCVYLKTKSILNLESVYYDYINIFKNGYSVVFHIMHSTL